MPCLETGDATLFYTVEGTGTGIASSMAVERPEHVLGVVALDAPYAADEAHRPVIEGMAERKEATGGRLPSRRLQRPGRTRRETWWTEL
jgi:hypothetical protein